MSFEMQIFYQAINTVVAYIYCVCQICILDNVADHRRHLAKTIFIYAFMSVIVCYMTETSVPVFVKSPVQAILYIILYRLLLTDKTAATAVHVVCSDLSILMQETIIIYVCKMNQIYPWVNVGNGVELGKARVILISCLIQIVLSIILKRFLKQGLEMMNEKSIWVLAFTGFFFFFIQETFKQLFFNYVDDIFLLVGVLLQLVVVFIVIVLYVIYAKCFDLQQEQREEQFKRELMEQQFAYYRDKQRDEEQVRSVYHDMKNHLLILQHQIHSPETAEMVETLQRKVENYADYVHTGNDFLDVIIKDKTRVAREKQITFSVSAGLYDMDFIKPLDISTIFGNGLDNAIAASMELPAGQREILVKMDRVSDVLSIGIENTCREQSVPDKEHNGKKDTDEKDRQFHGLGISNMRNAVDKYAGQLLTQCEAGRFTIKIRIPIPRITG